MHAIDIEEEREHEHEHALVGENALTIMGTHQLVLYTIPKSASILWIIGTFALIAAVEAALIFTVNKFCPFLVGKSRKEG